MKSDKKFDLMIAETFDLLFRSHEIQPPDHFPQISSANSSSVSQSFTLEEIEVKMKERITFFGLLYCKSFLISTF